MIRGMAFLHRDEDSPTRGANFSSSSQCSLDGRTVIRYLNNLGRQKHGVVRRCRSQQFDGVFRSDCARRGDFRLRVSSDDTLPSSCNDNRVTCR